MIDLVDRDRLVTIGRVRDAHGVAGALKVEPITDTPEYYEGCESLYIDSREGLRHHRVRELRPRGNLWLLTVEAVTDREAARALKGAEVLLPEEALRPLEPGEYFRYDLVGCEVETLAGQVLGRVEEVLEHTAQHVLVVSGAGGKVLIPLVAEIVKEVDIARRLIRADPPPGLLELNG